MKVISKEEAIQVLEQEGLIIYPTETFYALGCKCTSDKGIDAVYTIKERPKSMALPLIVGSRAQAFELTEISSELKPDVEILMNMWPASLSLLLPAKKSVSSVITGNTGKVVLRQSPHPVANYLAKEVGTALISTSANKSGKQAAAMLRDLDSSLNVQGVVQGANLAGDLPSTIAEPLGNRILKIIRKGAFPEEVLLSLGFKLVL